MSDTPQVLLARYLVNSNRHDPTFQPFDDDEENQENLDLDLAVRTFVASLVTKIQCEPAPPLKTTKTVRWADHQQVHIIPQADCHNDNSYARGKRIKRKRRIQTQYDILHGQLTTTRHICDSTLPAGQCPDYYFPLPSLRAGHHPPILLSASFPTLFTVRDLTKRWAAASLPSSTTITPAYHAADLGFHLHIICQQSFVMAEIMKRINTTLLYGFFREGADVKASLEALSAFRKQSVQPYEVWDRKVLDVHMCRFALEQAACELGDHLAAFRRSGECVESRVGKAREILSFLAASEGNGMCPNLARAIGSILAEKIAPSLRRILREVCSDIEFSDAEIGCSLNANEVEQDSDVDRMMEFAKGLQGFAIRLRRPCEAFGSDMIKSRRLGRMAENHERLRLCGLMEGCRLKIPGDEGIGNIVGYDKSKV